MSARRTRSVADPLEREIETALQPRTFIGYRSTFEFLGVVEVVQKRVEAVAKADPARGVRLFETFLAGAHAKSEEVDDSGGMFSQLVYDLFAGWTRARQRSGADPADTARWLADRFDDPKCITYRLQHDLLEALDRQGKLAFEREARARLDRKSGSRAWTEILGDVLIVRGEVDAFVALQEQTGIGARDCLRVAQVLRRKKKPADALRWVGRGLELGKARGGYPQHEHELEKLHRELLRTLGRGDDALRAAWESYVARPGEYEFRDLMEQVPKKDAKARSAWREKALDAAAKAPLAEALQLFLSVSDVERLVARVSAAKAAELEAVSHYVMDRVASRLKKEHPGLAGRAHAAMGFRVVEAKKSRYYDAALDNFRDAKRCLEAAGDTREWKRVVARMRRDHSRKSGVMAGFEEIVAGKAREVPADSFLDVARRKFTTPGSR